MSALRIVHLLASFEIGGAELVALRLAEQQHLDGHHPFMVAFAPGPLLERARERRVPCFVMHRRERFDATLPLRLATLLRDERAHVVHSHNPAGLVYAAPAAKVARIASVHTKHGEARDLPRRMMLLRGAARLVGAFVCVSSDTRAYAERTGEAPKERLHVIDNGVDTERFRPNPNARRAIREALAVPESVSLLGTVGRLNAVKNQALLLRAAAPLLGEACRLVLVGDGPERANLEATAARLGITDRVVFAGARADVAEVLAALDVMALSSDTEGLPLVLLEAMACGLPVVSTDVGGIRAALGEAGRLCDRGDEEALRGALRALRDDPTERTRLGLLGRERVVRHHSLRAMHEAYLALYRSLVGASS